MPRRTLTALAAVMLLGFALAQQSDDPATEDVAAAARTVTCQAAAPAWAALCTAETTVALLGPFEVMLGLEGRIAYADATASLTGSVAGFLTVAYWSDWGGAWLDVRLPEIVPPIGVSDWVRVGFTYRWAP